MPTLEAPTALDEMLAELDTCAPVAVAKYDKKNPPSIHIPRLDATAKRFIAMKEDEKNRQSEMDGLKADLLAGAAPHQMEFCRKFRCHVPTIKLNGLSVQCNPPHYTTAIKDPLRIKEIAALYGPHFQTMFRFVRLIPETPEIVACLKAAGIKYTMHAAPLKALHEQRWMPEITALLDQTPEVKPIWKVMV